MSEAFAAAYGRAVALWVARSDPHQAPAGQAGSVDRLGRDRAHARGLIHTPPWPACLATALGGPASVPAATFDAPDEAVVNIRVENPYWQFFCAETCLQTELPIDPSGLMCGRRRVGEDGVEVLVAASINAVWLGGVIQAASVQQVIVHTTVMPKAIAHPTDSRLLDRSRQQQVKAVEDNGRRLRQDYHCVAPCLAAQVGRYAHAKQFKRIKKRGAHYAHPLWPRTLRGAQSTARVA